MIFVHIPIDGYIGKILISVGLLGVSFFLAISGYACYGDKDRMCHLIIRRLKRNGMITAIIVALYIVFSYFIYLADGNSDAWIQELCKPATYARMLFIGDFEFFYGTPLWFLVALLYCYVFFYFVVRYNLRKTVYILLPLSIIARIATDIYVTSFGASWHLCANAIVGALPMMLIGYVIAEKEEKLKEIPLWVIISGTLISVLLMFLTECFNVGGYCIVQPFILLSSTLVFLLGLRKPGWYIFKPVSVLGQQDSLYVYLFHYMIIVIISRLAEGSPLPSWSISLIVVVVSLIFARALSVTIRLIKSNSRSGI